MYPTMSNYQVLKTRFYTGYQELKKFINLLAEGLGWKGSLF